MTIEARDWNDPYAFTSGADPEYQITRAAARVLNDLSEGEKQAYLDGLPTEDDMSAQRQTVGLLGTQKFSRSERRT